MRPQIEVQVVGVVHGPLCRRCADRGRGALCVWRRGCLCALSLGDDVVHTQVLDEQPADVAVRGRREGVVQLADLVMDALPVDCAYAARRGRKGEGKRRDRKQIKANKSNSKATQKKKTQKHAILEKGQRDWLK